MFVLRRGGLELDGEWLHPDLIGVEEQRVQMVVAMRATHGACPDRRAEREIGRS